MTTPKTLSDPVFVFRTTGSLMQLNQDGSWMDAVKGEARIYVYENGKKSGVSFLPNETVVVDTSSYIRNNLLFNGFIHEGLKAVHHNGEARCISFGKLPSWTYANAKGQAVKTYWAVRFKRSPQGAKDAECFCNLLKQFAQAEEDKQLQAVNQKFSMRAYDAESTKLDRNNSSDDSADDHNGLDSLDDFPDVPESQPITFRNPFDGDTDGN
jgi:hypothetical protein